MWSRTSSQRRADLSTADRARRTTVATELHIWLAITGAVVLTVIGIDGGLRAWRRSPRGRWAGRLETLLLLALGVTIAGGLGLLLGGARPRELLHFVYAIVALGVLPIVDSLSRRSRPRIRGIATLGAALIVGAIVVRLFQTG